MHEEAIADPPTQATAVDIGGVSLNVTDHPGSDAIRIVVDELRRDSYSLDRIPFRPGDVVIDVGAHVGLVSIYLAKRFPSLRVLAYEPTPANYTNLVHNLELNSVTNVTAHNLAVTSDGRHLEMTVHFGNSAGATGQLGEFDRPEHERFYASSTTLQEILDANELSRCRLLKLDCEGSEHEILHGADCLDRFDYLVSEFHINDYLERERGYSLEALIERCRRYFGKDRMFYSTIRMAD